MDGFLVRIVGFLDGFIDGDLVVSDGCIVGKEDGSDVGERVVILVGLREGVGVVLAVGTGVGNEETGTLEGVEVGRLVRALTVVLVGTAVGSNK